MEDNLSYFNCCLFVASLYINFQLEYSRFSSIPIWFTFSFLILMILRLFWVFMLAILFLSPKSIRYYMNIIEYNYIVHLILEHFLMILKNSRRAAITSSAILISELHLLISGVLSIRRICFAFLQNILNHRLSPGRIEQFVNTWK